MKYRDPGPVSFILESINDILYRSGWPDDDIAQAGYLCLFQGSPDTMHFSRQIPEVRSIVYFIVGKCQEYDRFEAQKIGILNNW